MRTLSAESLPPALKRLIHECFPDEEMLDIPDGSSVQFLKEPLGFGGIYYGKNSLFDPDLEPEDHGGTELLALRWALFWSPSNAPMVALFLVKVGRKWKLAFFWADVGLRKGAVEEVFSVIELSPREFFRELEESGIQFFERYRLTALQRASVADDLLEDGLMSWQWETVRHLEAAEGLWLPKADREIDLSYIGDCELDEDALALLEGTRGLAGLHLGPVMVSSAMGMSWRWYPLLEIFRLNALLDTGMGQSSRKVCIGQVSVRAENWVQMGSGRGFPESRAFDLYVVHFQGAWRIVVTSSSSSPREPWPSGADLCTPVELTVPEMVREFGRRGLEIFPPLATTVSGSVLRELNPPAADGGLPPDCLAKLAEICALAGHHAGPGNALDRELLTILPLDQALAVPRTACADAVMIGGIVDMACEDPGIGWDGLSLFLVRTGQGTWRIGAMLSRWVVVCHLAPVSVAEGCVFTDLEPEAMVNEFRSRGMAMFLPPREESIRKAAKSVLQELEGCSISNVK